MIRERDFSKNCGTVSRTHQSFKNECDINVVLRRYANDGVMPQLVQKAEPQYGDFSEATDYMEARHNVQQAWDDFMNLPSKVRTACENDPGKFLEMCADPKRVEELVELGLSESDLPGQMEIPVVEPATPPEPKPEAE